MLYVQNLTLTHRRDLRVLIDSLSFVLNPGDKTALIGEEGNGKSSLVSVLAHAWEPPAYLEVTGTVRATGRIGYLKQFISEADLALPIFAYVTSEPNADPADWQAINDVAARLFLPPEMLYDDRPLRTCSGGERTKLQLCRVLLGEPSVLLLDEPSNDLDLETLDWLERFVQNETRPLLFVSHDQTFIQNTANRILHIEHIHRRTTPVWTLSNTDLAMYLSERDASFERQSRLAAADKREYEQKMARYRRIENSVEHAQATISRQDPSGGRLLKKKMHAVKSLERRFAKEKENLTAKPDRENAVLLFADPAIGHHENKRILDFKLGALCVPDGGDQERLLARDLELTVLGQDKVAIIGRNGSGKSTLLKTLVEVLQKRSDLNVAYMPQNYEDELPLASLPVDFLAPSGLAEDRQQALNFLGCMRFEKHEMLHCIGDLSGGQKAKLFMLRFILQGADVWILDEPTRNFSPLSSPVVRDVMRAFNGALIAVSHDRQFLREVATTIYELTPNGLKNVSPP